MYKLLNKCIVVEYVEVKKGHKISQVGFKYLKFYAQHFSSI